MDDRQPNSIALADVVAARERLAGVVATTPLMRLPLERPGLELWVKLENLQPGRSFKLRGAYNAIAQLSDDQVRNGVYTASAGNHAQGVAWSAARRGIACTVLVPVGAPQTKLDAIRRLGGEIVAVPFDDWWQVLVTHAYAPLEPARFIHPASDLAVIAGNGTVGLEIIDQLPEVAAVLAPFGGGGLSCGIAAAFAGLRPGVPVYGCEVETGAPLAAAIAAGAPVECRREASFVDGIGGKQVLEEMYAPARRLLAGALVVSLEEVAAAIRLLVERASVIAEGAGAAALAAGLKGFDVEGPVVCVVSGGNLDPSALATILAGRVPEVSAPAR
jgi:threonine dehydratase